MFVISVTGGHYDWLSQVPKKYLATPLISKVISWPPVLKKTYGGHISTFVRIFVFFILVHRHRYFKKTDKYKHILLVITPLY